MYYVKKYDKIELENLDKHTQEKVSPSFNLSSHSFDNRNHFLLKYASYS